MYMKIRPISFASKRLTATEMKYSQIEREALAIIFGVNRFHQYLFGKKFTLVTDNKPLISIFGEKKGIPTLSANRLQRYALFLSGYQYEIEYISTKKNVADYFSRSVKNLPDDEIQHFGCWQNDIYVNYINNQENLPVKFEKIQEETAKDKTLNEVREFIRNGWPEKITNSELFPYFTKRNELSEESGAIFWGYRIVIPESLRVAILNEIHKTHLGIVKMKGMARGYLWWPSLDKNLEDVSKSCEDCLLFKSSPPKSPLINWNWPETPWERIHLDYMGPIFGNYFLIMVDAHSKWLECINMKNRITSTTTIDKVRSILLIWVCQN